MDAKKLRTRMKELADTIPLQADDNTLAQIGHYIELAGNYIQQTIDRHEHRLERNARREAAAQAAMPKKKATKRKPNATKEAEADVELAKMEQTDGSTVEIKD